MGDCGSGGHDAVEPGGAWCPLQVISAVALVALAIVRGNRTSLRTVRIWYGPPNPLQGATVLTWRVLPARTWTSPSQLPNVPHWPCWRTCVSMCACRLRDVLQRTEPLPVIWSLASVGAEAVNLQRVPTLPVPAIGSWPAVLPPAGRSETTSANAAQPPTSLHRLAIPLTPSVVSATVVRSYSDCYEPEDQQENAAAGSQASAIRSKTTTLTPKARELRNGLPASALTRTLTPLHPPGNSEVIGKSSRPALRERGARSGPPCNALEAGDTTPMWLCALHSRGGQEPSESAAKMFAMDATCEMSDPRMLWSGSEDRALKLPERQLLDAIAAGELDNHLVSIADAVHARRELLHTVRSATAIAQLRVGDTVMFNGNVRPRYLEHELAVITALDERWVTLRLARPVGRFRDSELRCPPLAVRKLGPAGSMPAA